jgi:hypothetical protein
MMRRVPLTDLTSWHEEGGDHRGSSGSLSGERKINNEMKTYSRCICDFSVVGRRRIQKSAFPSKHLTVVAARIKNLQP